MPNSKPNKHATGCDVDFNKPCNCSSHPRYRQEILGKIHLAVRTEFFDRNRKNMEFLADDIEAWHKAEIAKACKQAREKLFEQIRSEVIEHDPANRFNCVALRAEQLEALTRLESKS